MHLTTTELSSYLTSIIDSIYFYLLINTNTIILASLKLVFIFQYIGIRMKHLLKNYFTNWKKFLAPWWAILRAGKFRWPPPDTLSKIWKLLSCEKNSGFYWVQAFVIIFNSDAKSLMDPTMVEKVERKDVVAINTSEFLNLLIYLTDTWAM